MSDHYTQQLRERVEARHGPIHEQDVPGTPEQAAELARTDPERFNALADAGRIPAEALGGGGEDDDR